MNHSHSTLTGCGFNHIAIGPRFTILDVGCGGESEARMQALRATHLSLDECRALLAEAGYGNVQVASHPNGRWFCALARVPA